MNFNVIEHFKKSQKYGFVFEITTPLKLEKFSIALEYPLGSTGAHFQTWNLEFFGFYRDYVVLHSKKIKTENDNQQKHVIVMEGQNIQDIPKFHLFDEIIK